MFSCALESRLQSFGPGKLISQPTERVSCDRHAAINCLLKKKCFKAPVECSHFLQVEDQHKGRTGLVSQNYLKKNNPLRVKENLPYFFTDFVKDC